jgi:acetyl-CoA carboxylase carboxyl transferase subunit alpha
MLEHSIYSVISPEGCASILWHKAEKAADAAAAMRITAQDLIDLNIIDAIIPEPLGGAHREPETAIDAAGDAVEKAIRELSPMKPDELRRHRREKFLRIGTTAR